MSASAGPTRPGAQEPWRDPDAEPFLRIEGLTHRFGDHVVLDDISLSIYKGELFALLGASGSGKSTLLRALAGFLQPDAGRIILDGQDMAGVPPYLRPVNMMFQSYALFPHMSVADNVGFGLRQAGMRGTALKERVAEMLALVQMQDFGARRPAQLSGGQRQRVALARSLAPRPKLLLLDEPMGALDKRLRVATQFELMNIQEKLGVTFVIVTHDQEEAMTMATRLAIMDRGSFAQIGTPSEVYEYPNSRLTAEFIGEANIFAGVVAASDAAASRIGSSELTLDIVSAGPSPKPVGARVFVAIRPEKMTVDRIDPSAASPQPADNRLVGIVSEIGYFGDFFMYFIAVEGGHQIRVTQPNLRRISEQPITWGDQVVVQWPAPACVVLPE